jgi:hypothetical protein
MLKRSVSTRRGDSTVAFFWMTFFGEAKKVIGCRATPDLGTMSKLDKTNQKHRRKVVIITANFTTFLNWRNRLR